MNKLHIVDIKSKLDNCYECDGSPYKAYWYNISKEFLKIYKEYTGCDYPVYASIDGSKYIITEKPIEKIKEEVRDKMQKELYTDSASFPCFLLPQEKAVAISTPSKPNKVTAIPQASACTSYS